MFSIVAETTTGCLLAGSANGCKSEPAAQTGQTAANELVVAVRNGGCVDQLLQNEVRNISL